MGILKVDEVEPGMVLADAVRDSAGRILLGEGAEVSEKHLVLFRRRGIIELDIEGEGEVIEEIPLDPEVLAEARSLLRARFVHNDLMHPAVREVFDLVAERKAREMMKDREVQA